MKSETTRSLAVSGTLAMLAIAFSASPILAAQQTQPPVNQNRNAAQQQVQQPGQPAGQHTAGETPSLSTLLASKMMLANHCGIQIADLGAQRASNPDVRQFARMLADEHRELGETLKTMVPRELVSELARPMPVSQNSSDGRVAADGTSGQGRSNPAGVNPDRQVTRNESAVRTETSDVAGDHDIHHILKQMCQIEKAAAMKNSESILEMLGSKSESEFDRCFLGLQITGHTQMISFLESIQSAGPRDPESPNAGSNGLAATVEKVLPSLREHLEKAKSLARTLEKAEGKNSGN